MRTRGLALVLALLVATAPAALALCELTCASPAETNSGTQHSCHEEVAPETSLTIAAVFHSCSHADELPAACGVAAAGDDSVPLSLIVTPTPGIVPIQHAPSRWTPDDHPVPGPASACDALALRI